jgi:hypothetical protein
LAGANASIMIGYLQENNVHSWNSLLVTKILSKNTGIHQERIICRIDANSKDIFSPSIIDVPLHIQERKKNILTCQYWPMRRNKQ